MPSDILVAMDDSIHAERALEYALESYPDATVTVLHVVGVPSMLMGEAAGLALAADLEDAASERAEPVFERARAIAADLDHEIRTSEAVGHPARTIVDRAANYDLVVLGSHGADWRRATRRFLIGNVAETVVKRAPVPVVVVR